MSLENIQLDIILNVTGLAEIGAASTAMQGMVRAANGVVSSNDAQVRTGGRLTTMFGQWGNHLSQVERAYDAVFRAGMHMTMLGSQLTGVFQTGIGIIKTSTQQYADFQTQLVKTANAIGGITEGTPMWDALTRSIEKSATALGIYNPQQVAEGLYYWEGATGATIKTNKDLNTQLAAMSPLLQLAYMKNIDMKTAIYGVEGAMRMFHMSVGDTNNVVSVFYSLINKNAFEMGDLVNAMKMVGPIADTMHMSIYQVSEVLAGMADAGIRGSQAGQILRMELLKIEHPSKAAAKALDTLFEHTKGLGKSFNDIIFPGGKFVGYTQYINDMAKATMNLTDLQKGQLLGTIGTAREVAGLVRAIDNAQRSMKGLGTQTGATTETLDQAKADFASGWDNVTKTWAYLTGVLHDTFLPIIYAIGASITTQLTPFIGVATKIAQTLSDWVQNNPKFVALAEKIAAVVIIVAGLAGAFFSVLGSFTLLMAGIGVVIQGFGPILLVFGAIGALIAAIVYAIVNNIGGMKGAVSNLRDAIVGFFTALMGGNDKFKLSWGDVAKTLDDIVKTWAPRVANFINKVADAIRNISKNKEAMDLIRELGKLFLILFAASTAFRISSFLLSPVVGIFKDISGAINLVWDALMLIFGGFRILWAIVTTVGEVFITVMAAIAAAIGVPTAVVAGIAIAIIAIIALIVGYFTNFMGMRDAINGFVANVINFVSNLVSQFVAWLGQAWAWLTDQFSKGIAFLGTVPGKVGNFVGQIVSAIGGMVSTVISAIVKFFQDFVGNFGYNLGYVLGFFIGWVAQFLFHAGQWLVDMGGKILDFLSKLPGQFISWFGTVLGTLIPWLVNTFIPGVMAKIGELIGDIVNFFAGLPGQVIGVLSGVAGLVTSLIDFLSKVPGQLAKALLDIGNAIVQGIWNGIVGLKDWFAQQVQGFFKGIIDGIKHGLGISSPSKVFAEIGNYMIAGLAVGINGSSAATTAMQAHTAQLVALARMGSMQAAAALTGTGSMSFDSSTSRTLRVQVDVTSSDGSVDKLKATDISNALQGSDLVRALTHMATVN